MVRATASDRLCTAILAATFACLYGPYVYLGGFVRDDLGLLILERPASYLAYQRQQLSVLTMTARPVSALLHGLCYWYFDRAYWAYHALNLALFGASVALIHLALRKLFSAQLAFLTALFAIVYPCAGGTTFSSIMMNSNLAALLWSGALYAASVSARGRAQLLTGALLLLSLLSYEAFGPSCLLLILLALRDDPRRALRARLWQRARPVLAALALFALYRGLLEKLIFHTAFSRASWPGWLGLLNRLLLSHAKGVKVAVLDSLLITARSLRNVLSLAPWHAFALLVLLGLACWAFTRCLYEAPRARTQGEAPSLIASWFARHTRWSLPDLPGLDRLALSLLSFSLAHWIFVFSSYMPDAKGFENRTQGAIRFAVAFVFASLLVTVFQWLSRRASQRILAGIASLSIAAFGLSVVGQRQAWIGAAAYNDRVADRIVRAIRAHGLDRQESLTLIADIPAQFPEQVNHEPAFGEPWDLGPALSLRLPAITFVANTLKPAQTIVGPRDVTIHGWWHAAYPLYVYRARDESLTRVSSGAESRTLRITDVPISAL